MQCKAVVAALYHSYQCLPAATPVMPTSELEWMKCFVRANDVREVSIKYLRWRSRLPVAVRSCAASLLSGPNLRSAEVPDYATLLQALKNSESLQELIVQVTGWGLNPTPSLQFVVDSLRIILLRKLELLCCTGRSGFAECIFHRMELLQNNGYDLARDFANLIEFGSPRNCPDDHQQLSFWTIWKSLPNIRQITLEEPRFNGDTPAWFYPRLRALGSVWIEDAPISAQRLGPCVTHMRLTYSPFEPAQVIAALYECISTSVLDFLFVEGESQPFFCQQLWHLCVFLPLSRYDGQY